MDQSQYFDVVRGAMYVGLLISLPILGVALVAGVAVGLFQALTSIQEMTLTFVPKLAVMLAVFWITMGYMLQTLIGFFHGSLLPLVYGG